MKWIATWALGCLGGSALGAPSLFLTSVALAALVALATWSPRAAGRCGLAGSLLLGSLWGGWIDPPPAPVGSPEGSVVVEGTVTARRCGPPGDCRWRLEGAKAAGTALPGAIWLRGPRRGGLGPEAGDQVRVEVTLWGRRGQRNPGPPPPWARPPWRWHAVAEAVPEGAQGSPSWWQGTTAHLGSALDLPGREATGVYRAMLLGDRSGIPAPVRDAFVDTGCAHLLAISGLHLAVVGLGLHRILLWLLLLVPTLAQTRRVPALASALAILGIWAYVALIAPSQATLRAAVVLTMWLGASVFARGTRPARALALAAATLMTIQPSAALGASFQLSFAAACALVASAPRLAAITRWLGEPGRLEGAAWAWLAPRLATVYGISLVTFLATAPLAVSWFGQWAPVGVLVNVVAVPLVALVIVPLGFAWWLCTAAIPAVASPLSWLPQSAMGLLLDGLEGWAEVAGPAATSSWSHPVGLAWTVAFLALLAGGRWLRLAGVATAMGLLLMGTAPTSSALRVTVLDVGHGDAIVVQPPGGGAILVDAGGARYDGGSGAQVGRRQVVPALARLGVDAIDLLVISHADGDHIGGALQVARRLPVRQLWLPPCEGHGMAAAELARLVAAKGGAIRVAHRAPGVRWQGMELRVLWPPSTSAPLAAPCPRSRNASSLVLELRYGGRRVLLTGDMDARAEMALLGREPHLRADVLKVAHHGSRTSSSAAFLDAIRPRIALVSAPWKDGPMPPHHSVLQRLRTLARRTWLTGRDGAVQVEIAEDGSIRLRPP